MIALIIPYTILAIIIISALVKDYRKKGFAGALTGILAFSCFLYGIIPILFLILESNFKNNIGVYGFSDLYGMVYSSTDFYSHFILFSNCFIGLLFLFIGHKLSFKNSSAQKNASNLVARKNGISVLATRRLAVFCFLVGIISLAIYIYALGGIKNAILKAELLRGFSSTVEINSYLSLFKIPAALTPMSFYLFVITPKSSKKSIVEWLLVAISFAFTLLFLMINAGKTAIIILGAFVMFAIFSKKKRHVWFKMLIVSVLLLLSIPFIDDLFAFISYGSDHVQTYTTEQSFLRLIRQFSYPYQIELHLNDITGEYGFLFFKNIFTDIAGLLPGVSFEQSYANTSAFFNGVDWKLVSGVPNDLMSYGYLNLGIFGTAIYMLIVGWLAGFIDRCLINYPDSRYKRDLLAFLFACKMFSHVNSVDIQPIIQYDLSLILLIIMVAIISKRYSLKNSVRICSTPSYKRVSNINVDY